MNHYLEVYIEFRATGQFIVNILAYNLNRLLEINSFVILKTVFYIKMQGGEPKQSVYLHASFRINYKCHGRFTLVL